MIIFIAVALASAQGVGRELLDGEEFPEQRPAMRINSY